MDTLRWILLVIGILVLAGIYFFGKRSEWRQKTRGGEQNDPRFDEVSDVEGWDDGNDVIVLPKRQTSQNGSVEAAGNEWQDDVRPIRRDASAETTDAPAGEGGGWVEDVKRLPTEDESAKHAPPTPKVEEVDVLLADDDDGWIDDVRPIRRDHSKTRSDSPERADVAASPQEEPGQPEELLIIHVTAEPGSFFAGADIEEAFAANDLSFGVMQIYHRKADRGEPLFSVINMIKPGVFDPERFPELETPGISLFMQLPGPEQPMVAFRALSDCAQRLAERLGGRLQDESHSTLTTQTLGHYEERVRSYIQHHARRAGERRV